MTGGRRMEDLLMGGDDDDSSGSDDDNESKVAGGGSGRQASVTAAAAAAPSLVIPPAPATTVPPPPVVTTAPAATAAAAATTTTTHRSGASGHLAKPPIVGPRGDSKSELTNRLKNLYGTAVGGSGVGGAMVSPPMLPPPQIVPNVNSNANNANPKTSLLNASAAPAAAAAATATSNTSSINNNNNNSYIPPLVYTAHHRGGTGGGTGSGPSSSSNQQQLQQQQQHHPGLLHTPNATAASIGRIPAPLPEARSSIRSAHPSNRIASAPMSRPNSNSNTPSSSSSTTMMPTGPPPPSPLTTTSQQQQQQQQQQVSHYGRSSSNSSNSSNSNRQQLSQQQQQYAYSLHSQRGSIGPNTSATASSRSSSQQQQQQQQQQQMQRQQQQQQQQHSFHPSMQMQQQQDLLQVQESMAPTSYNKAPVSLSSGSSSRSSYSERTSHSAAVAGASTAYPPEQEKMEKERFLMFTRVLMKFLEQRDPAMHQVAKAQIKECYTKNKIGDPGFRSLTTSMNTRLRATVGETYWSKAQSYLEHFIEQKKKGNKDSSSSTTTTTTASFPPPLPGVSVVGGVPLSGSAPLPPAIVPTGMSHNRGGGGGGGGGGVNATTNLLPTATIAIPPSSTTIKPGGKKKKDPATTKEQKNQLARENRAKKKKEAAARAAAAAAAAATGSIRTMLPTGVGIANSTTATSMTTPGLVGSSSPSSGGMRSVTAVMAPAAAGTLASSQSTTTATVSSSSPTPSSVKAKNEKMESGGIKSAKRKSLTKSTTLSPSISKKKQQEPSNLFMESIDHATLLDVKRLPNILTSREVKLDVNINEEQKILLYGGDDEHRKKMKEITEASRMALDTDAGIDAHDAVFKEAGVPPLPSKIPTMYNGWGERNILSVRNAWARVRLPECDVRRAELEKEVSEKTSPTKPIVLSEGNVSPSSVAVDVLTIENDTTNHVWFNETRAEQDMTLALLSFATEQYLKSTIEGALRKARLRQNLDGVRLWHTLQAHAAAVTTAPGTMTSTKITGEDPPLPPPPALIRLGCDVRRQIALSEGNAAKIYQRMEEAISRRNECDQPNEDNERLLLESTSMADFSKKVPLKYAVQRADNDAKRKFAVFGGEHSMDPPLGRVPKEAKVTLQDLAVSALGSRTSMIGLRRKRFRAGWNF